MEEGVVLHPKREGKNARSIYITRGRDKDGGWMVGGRGREGNRGSKSEQS